MKEKIYIEKTPEEQEKMWEPKEGTAEAQNLRMQFLKEITSANALVPQTFDAVKHFGAKTLLEARIQGYESTLFTRTHSREEELRVGAYLSKARDRMHKKHNIETTGDNLHTTETMNELMNSFVGGSIRYLNDLKEDIDPELYDVKKIHEVFTWIRSQYMIERNEDLNEYKTLIEENKTSEATSLLSGVYRKMESDFKETVLYQDLVPTLTEKNLFLSKLFPYT